MKTEVDKYFNYGFVIDEQEMRRIHGLLLQQMKRVVREEDIVERYEVKYKNDLLTETSSFDGVFSESNGGKWEIQSIKMTMWAESDRYLDNIPRISLYLKKGFQPIDFHIKGDDRDWVYLTSSMLEDRIAKVKRINLKLSLFPSLLSGVFAGAAIALLIIFTSSLHLSKSVALTTLVILLTFLFVLIAFSPLILPYFFPTYNFCWGDYLDTFNRRQTFGKFILFSVLGTLVLGIIASVIASFLTSGL